MNNKQKGWSGEALVKWGAFTAFVTFVNYGAFFGSNGGVLLGLIILPMTLFFWIVLVGAVWYRFFAEDRQ